MTHRLIKSTSLLDSAIWLNVQTMSYRNQLAFTDAQMWWILFKCPLEEENICDILSKVEPLKLSPEEELAFRDVTICHMCQKELGSDKVLDNVHLPNGRYRGAAHAHCNFQYQFRQGKRSQSSKFYIPVVYHNLRGYDSHLMMTSAGKMKDKKLSVIPNNGEKYLSFLIGNFKIYRFFTVS